MAELNNAPDMIFKHKRKFYLVYQCGIANVFLDRAGRLVRVYQGNFSGAEGIIRGAELCDSEIIVQHCDRAGDIAICQELWQNGAGDMFKESKSR